MNDLGFLKELLKQAKFDILVLALAGTGWVVYHKYPDNIYIFCVALACSLYCGIRFLVLLYKKTVELWKNCSRKLKEHKERKIRKENWKRNITRMYDGLTEENKKRLDEVYLWCEKDKFEKNVFTVRKNSLHEARVASVSHHVNCGTLWPLRFTHYEDSITLHIDPVLCGLIQKDIKERGWDNKSNEGKEE